MKKYTVVQHVTRDWTLEVEAESADEALEIAWDASEDEWTPPDPGEYDEEYEVLLDGALVEDEEDE